MHTFSMLPLAMVSFIALALAVTNGISSTNRVPGTIGGVHLTTSASQDHSFSVKQVKNEAFVRSGPLAYAKALKKYGVGLSADLTSAISVKANNPAPGTAAAAHGIGTISTSPMKYDKEYVSSVQVGTPAQNLMMDFDTGSSDLWVFSTNTLPSEVEGQGLYSPNISTTAALLSGYRWRIMYGDDSSSSGAVYKDTVQIGGCSVQDQAVETATIVSSSFSADNSSSGLVGLGFSSINTVKPVTQKTWLENVIPSLLSPLFTANLKHGRVGNYNFGYIDSHEYNGSITYVPVDNSRGYWGYTTSGYAIGSGPMQIVDVAGISDTGTSLMLLDDSIVEAYYAQVEAAQYSSAYAGYVFPCTTVLPDFSFLVGNFTGVVPGSYINYAQESVTPASTGGLCYGGIQSSVEPGLSIWGDVLLKAHFVVYDYGNMQLGFASKAL